MSVATKTIPQPSLTQSAIMQVERATFDIRAGAWVLLVDDNSVALCANPETLREEDLKAWLAGSPKDAALLLTSVRAKRIGLDGNGKKTVRASLENIKTPGCIQAIIRPVPGKNSDISKLKLGPASALDDAAIQLSKQSFLLPCMLTHPLNIKPSEAKTYADEHSLVLAQADQIFAYGDDIANSVEIVSEAPVPLNIAPKARVVAFRPRIGNAEHLAVVVGDISKTASPLVRIHSSCMTGDILGSLRCDCGEQLHASIAAMDKEGAGVFLYLNQEGRGIGIANKLKAYTLQDAGMDTVDANEEMGFDADERTFLVAAKMLEKLGVKSLRLMTNNPQKTEDMSRYGVVIKERVPLVIEPNPHNTHYLDTKAKRCGHML